MKKVWLTYSWKDNDEDQVRWIIQEIEKQEIEVHLDNRDLVPGKKLWEQIAKLIADPEMCDAWVYLVTPNSLRSSACQEELGYALDRALESRGKDFPLIGLVDGKFDSKNLPSSLKIRLCISTYDPHWRARIKAGVNGQKPGVSQQEPILPYIIKTHSHENCIEVRPRCGSWMPFNVYVPIGEKDKLVEVITGPCGLIPTMFAGGVTTRTNKQLYNISIQTEVSPYVSGYIFLKGNPSTLYFGDNSERFEICPSRLLT